MSENSDVHSFCDQEHYIVNSFDHEKCYDLNVKCFCKSVNEKKMRNYPVCDLTKLREMLGDSEHQLSVNYCDHSANKNDHSTKCTPTKRNPGERKCSADDPYHSQVHMMKECLIETTVDDHIVLALIDSGAT